MTKTQRISCLGLGFILLSLLGCQPSEQPAATFSPAAIETPILPKASIAIPSKPSPLAQAPQAPQSAKPAATTASAPPSAIPESFISEGTLTAKDAKAQINLRSTPSAKGKLLGYGVVGDKVRVLAQKETEGYVWQFVKFPKSGTKAWVRGDFLKTDTKSGQASGAASPASPSSATATAKSPIRKSVAAGNCECPYDTDKIGKACGARSAYSKASGRKPVCYVGES